jgi:hypothetical protein
VRSSLLLRTETPNSPTRSYEVARGSPKNAQKNVLKNVLRNALKAETKNVISFYLLLSTYDYEK